MTIGDKILCPWCGAEMEHVIYNDAVWCTGEGKLHEAYHAFYRCRKCGAQGPVEYRSHGPAAEEAARAAALRRYNPPLKPMTRQELPRRYLMPCWIEQRGEDAFPDLLDKDSVGFYGKFENLNARETNYLFYAQYGKTWRCWERKPTKEEMEAAGWEK